MRYVVIDNFCDMKDGDKAYKPGDTFESTNIARIKELSSAENKLGRPLIKAMYEEPEIIEVEETPIENESVETPVETVADGSFMNEPVEEIPVAEEPVKKRRGRKSTK